MFEENEITLEDDGDVFEEELALEFDVTHDPEAVWEWDGQGWIAVGA